MGDSKYEITHGVEQQRDGFMVSIKRYANGFTAMHHTWSNIATAYGVSVRLHRKNNY